MIIEYELIYILKKNDIIQITILIQIAEKIGYCYEIETFALAPCGSSIGNACGA